jgi:hypothetical protein
MAQLEETLWHSWRRLYGTAGGDFMAQLEETLLLQKTSMCFKTQL